MINQLQTWRKSNRQMTDLCYKEVLLHHDSDTVNEPMIFDRTGRHERRDCKNRCEMRDVVRLRILFFLLILKHEYRVINYDCTRDNSQSQKVQPKPGVAPQGSSES